MRVLLEETVEVLDTFVAQSRGNGAHLRRRIYAQQPLCGLKASLHLKLRHRHLVFAGEGPLQRPHLHGNFSCDGAQPQTYIAV